MRDEFIEGLLESASVAETTILISSHDLAEIESFASHVGYLENGQLRFSEEMSALSARFREVLITLPNALTRLPADLPESWLRPQASGVTVRFAASAFDEPATFAEIRRIFPDVSDISATPMALREIFVAMARRSKR